MGLLHYSRKEQKLSAAQQALYIVLLRNLCATLALQTARKYS